MTVLVTHPGRQHSHRAALALEGAGLLTAYWSGVPSSPEHFERAPAWLRARLRGYHPVELPAAKTAWFPFTPTRRRVGDTLLPKGLAAWNDFAACRGFDRVVRRRLDTVRFSVVLACEISARDTFRASRDRNLLRVLDAPSLHPATQDRLHGTTDSPRLHRAIRRVKEEEIALADRILTVSRLARETYLEAGVAPEKVHAVPLGADLELFRPPAVARALAVDAPIRFLFAGATIERKGFDLLLSALDRVASQGGRFELRLVGPSTNERWRSRPWASSAGSLDQAGLAAEMQRAHLLVLPSRNDSYGMVVAEALATGLPALVSTMVGAKDLIDHGANGWVVPVGDVDALTARLLDCATQPRVVLAMADSARRAAESATWDGYSKRLVTWFQELLAA